MKKEETGNPVFIPRIWAIFNR